MRRIVLWAGVVFALVGNSSTQAAGQYSKDYIGETKVYKAVFEDTLIHLARSNNLGFVEVRAANPELDAWIPGAGAKIILPKQHILPDAPRSGIVVNLAEMRMYYYKDKGKEPITHPISIGREGLQTPIGTTTVMRKMAGPTWRPTPRMREEKPELPESVPPGPDNPLGTHAMYLGWSQYLIHGTNKPYGVGRRASSGCIRMYPEDIASLFPQVPVGTKVTVVDQPVKVGWIEDGLFIEVSPTQEQSLNIEEDSNVGSYTLTQEDRNRIIKKAGNHADRIDWKLVEAEVTAHRGYPIEILTLSPRELTKPVVSEKAAEEKKPEAVAVKPVQVPEIKPAAAPVAPVIEKPAMIKKPAVLKEANNASAEKAVMRLNN